jgi:hypothetical protein
LPGIKEVVENRESQSCFLHRIPACISPFLFSKGRNWYLLHFAFRACYMPQVYASCALALAWRQTSIVKHSGVTTKLYC